MNKDWTPGQKLTAVLLGEKRENPPMVDEDGLWHELQLIFSKKTPWEKSQMVSDRKLLVLELRYGRKTGSAITLEAVANVLPRINGGIGVNRERARQIELQALRKLRYKKNKDRLNNYISSGAESN